MQCFDPSCPHPALYTFHSGGLCIEHAAQTRQHAPQVVLTPITADDEPTDPNHEGMHETRPVGSAYPGEGKPGE